MVSLMQQANGTNSGSTPAEGLAPNLAGALSYVLGLVTGIVFLMLSKDPFVRFHAYQSILLSVGWVVFWIAVSIVEAVLFQIPFLGFLVAIISMLAGLVLGLGLLVLWIVLMLRAYQGQQWKLPFIGNMAEKYAAGQRAN